MKRKKYPWCILFILLFSFFGYTWFSFWEPSDFKKDSLTFIIKVPSKIKKFDDIYAVSTPLYRYRFAGGVTPSIVVMSYYSSASLQELVEHMESLRLSCTYLADANVTECNGMYGEFYSHHLLTQHNNTIEVHTTFSY